MTWFVRLQHKLHARACTHTFFWENGLQCCAIHSTSLFFICSSTCIYFLLWSCFAVYIRKFSHGGISDHMSQITQLFWLGCSHLYHSHIGSSKWFVPCGPSFVAEVFGYLQEGLCSVGSESKCTIESDHDKECGEAESQTFIHCRFLLGHFDFFVYYTRT